MATIELTKPILGVTITQKLGRRYAYGRAMYGQSLYGDCGLYAWLAGYGAVFYPAFHYGDDDELSGIYQVKSRWSASSISRQNFYIPKNTYSVAKENSQIKFKAAVAGWPLLTDEQRAGYNKKAIHKHFTGRNLFIKEYMLS